MSLAGSRGGGAGQLLVMAPPMVRVSWCWYLSGGPSGGTNNPEFGANKSKKIKELQFSEGIPPSPPINQ